MQTRLLPLLRCPLSGSELRMEAFSFQEKNGESCVESGLLFGRGSLVYPILRGVPRLVVEAMWDYETELQAWLPELKVRQQQALQEFGESIRLAQKRNARTKASFSVEWAAHQGEGDLTWNLKGEDLLRRFENETGHKLDFWKGKWVLDAGCGNGILDRLLAEQGVPVLAMDFSNSVEAAYQRNTSPLACFIQADLAHPPFAPGFFELVHCSGVLIHTPNTRNSFRILHDFVKPGGWYSIWVYGKSADALHNLFNQIRNITSRIPVRWQEPVLQYTLFPLVWLAKRAKGNPQKSREMMVEILDWFTPEYRWEHEPEEVHGWYQELGYAQIRTTDQNDWGFHVVGQRK